MERAIESVWDVSVENSTKFNTVNVFLGLALTKDLFPAVRVHFLSMRMKESTRSIDIYAGDDVIESLAFDQGVNLSRIFLSLLKIRTIVKKGNVWFFYDENSLSVITEPYTHSVQIERKVNKNELVFKYDDWY